MFWRGRKRENKEHNGGPPCGQVRGVVGDTAYYLWNFGMYQDLNDIKIASLSLFDSQINSVMFVHDLSQRRTKTSLQKWAAEIAATGTFSAPLASGGPGGLPVPYIVIVNKADIATKEGTQGSSGNPVDAARQWVERQGLLSSNKELPLTESFPGSGGLLSLKHLDLPNIQRKLCILPLRLPKKPG
ncbi:small GTPase LIP1-like isoform X4 [Olea europaea var. sylvestris]|uniref:small GTPase LIP1-like isoform X4 n=1 Tax=Olea europaea var. sylvestris TaxID=158386 RepID=UPI000C1CF05A|nr:small GTPase LIP1-like isoform X4 [Olea europaea var. sylvestris]